MNDIRCIIFRLAQQHRMKPNNIEYSKDFRYYWDTNHTVGLHYKPFFMGYIGIVNFRQYYPYRPFRWTGRSICNIRKHKYVSYDFPVNY